MATLARAAVTVGEPAGIGADLLLALIQKPQPLLPVVFADFRLLKARALALDLPLTLHAYEGQTTVLPLGELYGIDLPQAGSLAPGSIDTANVPQILASLDAATDACLHDNFATLITGPVNKAAMNASGTVFTGQTEWIARHCGLDLPVMMLASDTLRVALVTTHLPLASVPDAITASRLASVVRIVAHDLKRFFGITAPKMAVCGLNPHAGELGYLGTEEQTIINPCLTTLRQEGLNVSEAMPADTVFVPNIAKAFDAIIAMYHDQGLSVIKAEGFGRTVNMTLGLPICRLSVDHGTALSLAGTGQANANSLQTVFQLAATLAQSGSHAR